MSLPHRSTRATLLALALSVAPLAAAQKNPAPPTKEMQARLQQLPPEERERLMSYTPELRQKAMALSPQTKAMLKKLHDQHPRRSQSLTLRQVMQEVLADYESIVSGLAADNAEQAADAARRLASHRIPKGGLLPYFALEHVNDADLGVLQTMNDAVEGNALKLAEAADRGDMAGAAARLSDIIIGCVACHQKFRGQPGVSANLVK